jgi:uncharacterized membrane protein (UPF0127 family)
VLPGGLRVAEARSARARLLGLSFVDAPAPGDALLLTRCRSVHTFGMRFALDLVWLDGRGRVVRVERGVRPRRLAWCLRARAVVEVPAGQAPALLEALGRGGRALTSAR